MDLIFISREGFSKQVNILLKIVKKTANNMNLVVI